MPFDLRLRGGYRDDRDCLLIQIAVRQSSAAQDLRERFVCRVLPDGSPRTNEGHILRRVDDLEIAFFGEGAERWTELLSGDVSVYIVHRRLYVGGDRQADD